MPKVVFTPSGLSGEVPEGTSVLDAARRLGADLDTVCGGRGICGRCQVTVSVGDFAKWSITSTDAALSPPGPLETAYHGARALVPGQRLGCAAAVRADVVVDVPPASQVHHQVIRKDLDLPALVVDPLISMHYVEIARAELGDGRSAADLLTVALELQHGVRARCVTAPVLRHLHEALRSGRATAAVRDGDVVGVWAGYVDGAYGVAVDVGSTTIAAHLCELFTGQVVASAGRMNPQIRYGEDLMSRVSYVMMNAGGDRVLTDAVRRAVDELVGELLAAAGQRRDSVVDVVLVGNPIMHHVLLGIDPTPLGQAPFTLATADPVGGPATDLDLDLPFATFYAGPCIAGHVGADTAAAMLAEGPHRAEAMQLLVDVGTNAEIVLGDRHRQYAASSPTGPAFEGAQISCGQRATAGAVEAVRIDPHTGRARVRVIGAPQWSDEDGFAESIAATGITGVCGSGIIDLIAEMYLAGLLDADGTIRGDAARHCPDVEADGRTFRYVFARDGERRLTLTQNDVRAVQLAKAALRAGIDLLVEHAGSPVVADIRLAGAFGAHIDPLHAMILGLVPDCPLDGVRSVGNAAGAGAVAALLSRRARAEMEQAVRRVEKIETATEPRFQELFVHAMALPHRTAPAPNLAALVDLPPPRHGDAAAAGADGSRRRRRRDRCER